MSATTTSRIIDMLNRYGRATSLRRRIGTTNSFTECNPRGLRVGYEANELIGGIVQGDSKVVISDAEIAAASWPGPPRKGDIVVVDGASYTVQTSAPRYKGPLTVAHVMTVRG